MGRRYVPGQWLDEITPERLANPSTRESELLIGSASACCLWRNVTMNPAGRTEVFASKSAAGDKGCGVGVPGNWPE